MHTIRRIQQPSHFIDYPYKPTPLVENEALKIVLSFTQKHSEVGIYIFPKKRKKRKLTEQDFFLRSFCYVKSL